MNEHWQQYPVRRGSETVAALLSILQPEGSLSPLGYIGGSYAAFMAWPTDTPVMPNDIDVFCASADNATLIQNKLTDFDYWLYDWNDVVVTLENQGKLPNIQLVKPNPAWASFPDDVLNDFDLSVCRAMLIAPNTVIADESMGSQEGKLLRINNPLRSLKRVVKYAARGITFNDHELLKLFRAWEQLPEEKRTEMCERAEADLQPEFVPEYDFFYDDDWFDAE